MSEPHITSHNGSTDRQEFPDPNRNEDHPITPFYRIVQPQREQEGKYQYTGKHNKFTENTEKKKPRSSL